MGGVQAKPQRQHRAYERKSSFPKKQVVPLISNDSEQVRVFENLMTSYQADCEDDQDLRDFDAGLRTGAEEVKRSKGFNLLENCLKYVTQSDEKIASEISVCRQKILEAVNGKKEMLENEMLLDHLMSEYLDNSLQTLQLCSTELQEFIYSARHVHSCITDVLRDRKESKKLDEARQKYYLSAEAVVLKVNTMQDRHAALLDKLNERVQKLDKKLDLARTLKKVVHMVFIGVLSGLFVCTIMAAAMAAPPVASALTTHPCIAGVVAGGAVVYAFSPVFKEGRHWLLSFIQGYRSTLEAHKGLIKSMEAGTGDAIKQLNDIMCHVDRIIAKGNDPVLLNLSLADDQGTGIEDPEVVIKAKLADFDHEIEELNNRREECCKNTEMARDKVSKEYKELKRSDVFYNTKIKKK